MEHKHLAELLDAAVWEGGGDGSFLSPTCSAEPSPCPRGLQQQHRGQQTWGQPPARAAAAETLGAASTKPSCGHAAAPGARGTGLQLPQRLSTGPGVRVLGGLAGKQLGCLGEPGLGTAHRWAAWETKPCLSTVNETGPREMRAGARGEGEFVCVIPTPSPLLTSALQA